MLLPIDSSISPFTVATLPNPATLATGTSFAITDYGGNIATAVGGQWRFEFPFRTTWGNRPPVNLVPAGTELQVTDYANQTWVCDGTYWRPAQGRTSLFADCADVGTVLASLSGVNQGQFSIPLLKIPAGMIVPESQIVITQRGYKTGTGGSVRFVASLGTTGVPTSDPGIVSVVSGTGNNACVYAQCAGVFGSAKNRMMAINNGEGAVSIPAGAVPAFQSSNINTDADMFVTMWVTNGNVADVFNLTSYRVWLEA